ncbi:NBR1-Ig-like domain-containing protein [Candidatus Thiothrix sp. Deng01]|uniref:NBR1-Ig-like domain-containing protein n=1 Tax=Candidatus Thiothrix phosphatis TaxID=3112415 RepID=A0ABU6CY00_9GAMM|nr:NBR1-Ig-like domain-containing protein [Candidatus Thiothrix sp. Deng01]MEB4590973.1 NBR1-Ig-like domain-containing protein [Candidatus Thiothrix sp. Deng01]
MDNGFGSFIRSRTQEKNLSISQLAELAGINRKALYNLLDGSVGETKFKTLTKLAIVLDMHPMELFSAYFESIDFAYDGNITAGRTDTLIESDDIGFIDDVTMPDGSTVSVCTTFDKIWRIQNTGKVHWQGRSLICVDELLEVRGMDGRRMTHGLRTARKQYSVPDVAPGERIDLTITFTAPGYACSVISCWKMVDADGEFCFPSNEPLSCMVRVISL